MHDKSSVEHTSLWNGNDDAFNMVVLRHLLILNGKILYMRESPFSRCKVQCYLSSALRKEIGYNDVNQSKDRWNIIQLLIYINTIKSINHECWFKISVGFVFYYKSEYMILKNKCKKEKK